MKKLSKIGIAGATILTLVGTSIPALASSVQPRGMIDEQSKVTAMPSYAGGGNVYTWSQVNVSTNSLTLLDWSMYTGYASATLSQKNVYKTSKTVYFEAIYDFTAESYWFQVKHTY